MKKKLKVLLVFSTLLYIPLVANQTHPPLENYISSIKKEQFNYDYKKNEAQSSILKDSWINPLSLSYTYIKTDPTDDVQTNQSAQIRMNQTIFQTGGIYYAIKYANALKKYSNYSIDMAKRKMVIDVISLLMKIEQSTLSIERQKLQIQNSEINLEQKKEQYLNGQLDSGFLDTAIIEKNMKTQLLYDIETAKERLVSSFSTLSDLSYKDAKVPYFETLTEDEFLQNNILLKMSKAKIVTDSYKTDIVTAKYLPKVSLIAGYSWTKSENSATKIRTVERDYYDYGLQLSMPLSINTLRDMEVTKIESLKSKIDEKDKIIQLRSSYEKVMQNVSNFEKKQSLSLENIELYSKLLQDTKKLFKAGYKTQYDVDTLENSTKISELDSKIYEIDKQLELLTLYELYDNGRR